MEDEGSGQRTDVRLSGVREDARQAAAIENGLAADGTAWFIPAMTKPRLKLLQNAGRRGAPRRSARAKGAPTAEGNEAMSEAQVESRAKKHAH
jgi:hypothetical protein